MKWKFILATNKYKKKTDTQNFNNMNSIYSAGYESSTRATTQTVGQ